jgi:hypothetical protein
MSLISLSYVFSSGTTIIASQTNANNTVFLNAINGGLDNTNLTGSAGITYANLTLGGNIVNADINTAAAIANTKLNLASITGTFNIGTAHQGDVFYDNGTTFTRLTPGTSGQFLQTQGTSANPQWATAAGLSNVLFQYGASIDSITNAGEITSTTSLVASATGFIYRYFASNGQSGSSGDIVFKTKYTHTAGISTVTVWARLWGKTNGSTQSELKVAIGSVNGNVSSGNVQVPTWYSFTISVTSLTIGTTYDVTGTLIDATGSNNTVYCGNVIALGS